jgi:hypothetical protein
MRLADEEEQVGCQHATLPNAPHHWERGYGRAIEVHCTFRAHEK